MIFISSRSTEGAIYFKNKKSDNWERYDGDYNDFTYCEIDENSECNRVKASEFKIENADDSETVEIFPDYKSTDENLEVKLDELQAKFNLPDAWKEEELYSVKSLRVSKIIGTVISQN